jgi:anti-anti-sigma factor
MRDAAVGALRISVEPGEAVVVVRVEGDVDLDNADKLSAALRTAADSWEGGVVLDLLGVPFMDSSGLKALLVASAALGDRLSLTMSPGAPVARLLELAEVRDRFSIRTASP